VENKEGKNLPGVPMSRWNDIAMCLAEIAWSS